MNYGGDCRTAPATPGKLKSQCNREISRSSWMNIVFVLPSKFPCSHDGRLPACPTLRNTWPPTKWFCFPSIPTPAPLILNLFWPEVEWDNYNFPQIEFCRVETDLSCKNYLKYCTFQLEDTHDQYSVNTHGGFKLKSSPRLGK